MKRTAFFITALILSTFSINANNNPQPLPVQYGEVEKDFLMEYYERTFSNLERHVEGLSEEQLRFSPSDETWNILQTLEHILIVERSLFEMTMELMAQPENPDSIEEVQMTDNELVQMIESRDEKFKAPEEVHPQGAYSTSEEIMEEFRNLRQEMLQILEETSEEDLRNRVGDSPMGMLDAYQFYLFIAAHTARHTNQIEEIKTAEGFPRE